MSSSRNVRVSADQPSSAHSSISDIEVRASPPEDTPLRQSESSEDLQNNAIQDLELEDPLSRVYVRDDFEPFSKTEWGFITISCLGVVSVPLLYLIVSRIQVCFILSVLIHTGLD